MACTNVLEVFVVRYFLIHLMCYSWEKTDLQALFIKGIKVILLSKYAPRFLADSTGEIIASPTDRVSVRTFLSCYEVPMIRNSVLASFSFTLSWIIHARTALMHFYIAEKHSASLALKRYVKVVCRLHKHARTGDGAFWSRIPSWHTE